MKTIPPLNDPSNPSQKIYMREALVSETISFVEVSGEHEEQCTTLFLNTIQDQKHFTDSQKWTAATRRLALFWYWIHVAPITDQMVNAPYECSYCGKTHNEFFALRELSKNFKNIQGKPERDIEFEGAPIRVRPLNGADMEELEDMRLLLRQIEAEKGKKSGEFQKQRYVIQLQERLLAIDFPEDKETDLEKRKDNQSARIDNLSAFELDSLVAQIEKAQSEMKHGLASEIREGKLYLLSPEFPCPEESGKGERSRVLITFRDYIIIQGLHKKGLD